MVGERVCVFAFALSLLPSPFFPSLFSPLSPFSEVLINVAAPQRGDRVTTSFFFKKTWLSQQRLAKIFQKKSFIHMDNPLSLF
jgi:hypothetical protein